MSSDSLTDQHIEEGLEVWWPKLEIKLVKLPKATTTHTQRKDREILEEILSLVRDDSRLRELSYAPPKARGDRIAEFLVELLAASGSDSSSVMRTHQSDGIEFEIKLGGVKLTSFKIADDSSLSEALEFAEAQVLRAMRHPRFIQKKVPTETVA